MFEGIIIFIATAITIARLSNWLDRRNGVSNDASITRDVLNHKHNNFSDETIEVEKKELDLGD